MPLNSGYDYRETCCNSTPEPVEQYLARRYSHSSATLWRERLTNGQILIAQRVAAPNDTVAAGQEIVWRRPPWEEPQAPAFEQVLYEDDAVIAVTKPAGLPTIPAGGFLEQTLLHQVRQRYPGASPAHRLGRFTTGVVLFGRTPEALAKIDASWRADEVTKIYRALVHGQVHFGDCCLTHPVRPCPHPILGKLWQFHANGRPSRCQVRWLTRSSDRTLCEIALITGRPHQIRIQLAAAGHPLLGDPLFDPGGRVAAGNSALPGDPGYTLHAWKLELPHPLTRAPLAVEAPLPPELNE